MIGNTLVVSFRNKLKIREYAEGYRIFDLRRGNSRGREWKSSIFFFLGLSMLFILLMNGFNVAGYPVAAIVLLICMYMCSHYLYMLPKKAKLKGEHIFRSSKLLSKEYQFDIYRDYFLMKNEYETLKRYYTEITDCIETDSIFVLIGGFEHRVTVISKRCLSEEKSEKLTELFSSEMIKQYRRTGGKKKNEKGSK